MDQKFFQYRNRLAGVSGYGDYAQFVLLGFKKNRVSYSARSCLIHRDGYEFAVDCTDCLARLRLSSESLMNYLG